MKVTKNVVHDDDHGPCRKSTEDSKWYLQTDNLEKARFTPYTNHMLKSTEHKDITKKLQMD